ncbi:polysaccharide biosynthesis/export family protein [Paludibaculum fermentans]|uniref:polysaccharide biosynthesis/export family protein n=1 Tax=Paludibaculum fermentans TaxID=1473598 RepID=UPI003EC0741F
MLRSVMLGFVLMLGVGDLTWGQRAQRPAGGATQPSSLDQISNAVRPDYTMGPEDQILIRSAQVPEINERPFRIDSEGFVELPIVGKIRAGGMTVQAFEKELTSRLREYVRDPQVFISLAQFRGEPVFFVGAFGAPGIYPLSGRRTLVEMLTVVGGISPNATRRIKITRRTDYGPMPLPNAVENPEKKISTVEISLSSLSENINPEEDIVLQPYDVISAERAERVYVSGEVGRPASIELGERSSISIAQALTEAGGFTPTANRSQVRILRPISGTDRRAEILIDAKRVFEGKERDFPLLPNDVLYVPGSSVQALLARTGSGLLSSIPYLVITILARR